MAMVLSQGDESAIKIGGNARQMPIARILRVLRD